MISSHFFGRQKNKAKIMVYSFLFIVLHKESQGHSEDEERLLEKTKPICKELKLAQAFTIYGITLESYTFNVKESKAKQSQFAGHWPEIRNTKLEIRNELNGCYLKKQSQFSEGQNEHKYLYVKELREYWAILAKKKQSQFARIAYCVLRIAI